MSGTRSVPCVGCGGMFREHDGPTHRYMESSPGCWEAFGKVLAREYGDPAYRRSHRLTVDAYAVQHPGRQSPQAIQSVAVHLIGLSLVLERGVDMLRATSAIRIAASRKNFYRWLEPPSSRGDTTVAEVLRARNAEEHRVAVDAWARAVWLAWSAHHDTVRAWASDLLVAD
ncbi:MAG: DUF5946 family protein [Acidobacteriia bacterium]|nr:DUF5946 family protein [Terriglobia bacterium]